LFAESKDAIGSDLFMSKNLNIFHHFYFAQHEDYHHNMRRMRQIFSTNQHNVSFRISQSLLYNGKWTPSSYHFLILVIKIWFQWHFVFKKFV